MSSKKGKAEAAAESKRKRNELSSQSEKDTSVNSPVNDKQKKKKKKQDIKTVNELTSDEETEPSSEDLNLTKQLSEINKKLSNVLTKDDANLKSMIKKSYRK